MHLLLIGINHETAPVDLREKLSFDAEETESFLKSLHAHERVKACLLISTCNRTELLVNHSLHAENLTEFKHELIDAICGFKRIQALDAKLFDSYQDSKTVQHLFRLAAGLESMVVGEAQILGQVKQAYKITCQAETGNFLINKLMHRTFKAAKRVRTETNIGTGAGSVSQAAANLLEAKLGELDGDQILIIGAGEMARICAEALAKRHATRLTITNRTMSRAHQLATRLHCRIRAFEELTKAIDEADAIITAVAGSTPLLEALHLEDVDRAKVFVDIGVPRNVAPAVAEHPLIDLYSIDDLQSVVDDSLTNRRLEIPKAEAIIAEELDQFTRWFRSLAVEPTIKKLITSFEAIRQEELQRLRGNSDNGEMEKLEELSKRLTKKLLHFPISHLRNSHHGHVDKSDYWIDIISDVFDLEDE